MTTKQDIIAAAAEAYNAMRRTPTFVALSTEQKIEAVLNAVEFWQMQAAFEAVKSHAISMDCGRMCDNNKNLIFREQWKRSEEYVEGLIKQAPQAPESEGL